MAFGARSYQPKKIEKNTIYVKRNIVLLKQNNIELNFEKKAQG
jgi:hypothetical protein